MINGKLGAIILLLFCHGVRADFDDWKQSFSQHAIDNNVSEITVKNFLQSAYPYEQAIASDRSQAEFKKFLWDYLKTAVSASRVNNGQQAFYQNTELLNSIAEQTGVSSQIITAIWGMETNYGGYTGNVPLVSSLATLAHEGRRSSFFRGELLAFLQLVDSGDIPAITVEGSWAGGMGLTQFIPTTYQRYAVDFDGDGQRDLWGKADALASSGYYLQAMGWQAGYRWGREVSLSQGFNYYLANDKSLKKSLSEWSQLGVTDAHGLPLSNDSIQARLFVPAGQFGPKFLLYKNFDVIKRYNNSDSYALAVSLLSDAISGNPNLSVTWPTNAKKVSTIDIKLIQTALNAYGFDAGKIDGIMGNGTRRALQSYQAAHGMVADGFLTIDLYRKLVTGIE